MKKRDFLKKLGFAAVATAPGFRKMNDLINDVSGRSVAQVATDEDFWAEVRAGYRLKPDYINLENGYYCIQPTETLENHIQHVREINYQGSWYMRKDRFRNKEMVADRLADLIGADHGEVVITRNTTESLDLVIGGFPWENGDEAIFADQGLFFDAIHVPIARGN